MSSINPIVQADHTCDGAHANYERCLEAEIAAARELNAALKALRSYVMNNKPTPVKVLRRYYKAVTEFRAAVTEREHANKHWNSASARWMELLGARP